MYVGKREEKVFQAVGTAYMQAAGWEKRSVLGELKKGQCDWNLQRVTHYGPRAQFSQVFKIEVYFT